MTSSKTAVQPLKATPASRRPRTEQYTDTTHRPTCRTNKLIKHAGQRKTKQGDYTPDNIPRDDKDKIRAWIPPAVTTNEGDPRVHQATKNITRQNEDNTNRKTRKAPAVTTNEGDRQASPANKNHTNY